MYILLLLIEYSKNVNVAQFLKIFALLMLLLGAFYVLSLIGLFSQVSRYQKYWNKNNQAADEPGQLLYVALGDSTAQGIGASSPSKGYVGLIADGIRNKEQKPVRVVNLSKSGAKLDDVLSRQIPEMNKQKIDKQTVITMEIGANDMVSFDPKKFESQMDEIMQNMPSQTLLTDLPYFGGSRHRNLEGNVIQANEIMYRLAKKHNLKLVALHDRMKHNGGLKTLAPDLFHPSNTAYRENWAYSFLQRVEQ
jgi:acyl-CoA thioesterase-1